MLPTKQDGAVFVQAEPMLLYLVKQVELAIRSHLDELLRPAGLTALRTRR